MKATTKALAAVPQWIYSPLRKLRTVALFLAEPFDRAHQLLTGRSNLPPLWLRRHVGPVPAFERAPGEIAAVIALRQLMTPDSVVLDLGCGSGAMAFEFARFMGPRGHYIGFDVHEASIKWARSRFESDARFTFHLAELRTPYSEGYTERAASYAFPCADASVDFVLGKSLFTHLLELETRHYLGEIGRVLRKDGQALITAFLIREPGETALEGAMFEFRYGGPDEWHLVETKPTAAVAYRLEHFESMVTEAGLEIREAIFGNWRGAGIAPNAQDLLILSRRSTS